ncbi:MAG: DUF3987 domain-containing protein, partial [Phycisphaerae bacterium]|nr:DUF3987 domain-containing protein [Phycisphaerae bacterium]
TGGIQPGTLARALGAEHFEDGLAARLLLAMPPDRPRRWSEADVPEATRAALADLFARLWALPLGVADDNAPQPTVVGFTPKARARFIAFVNRHGEKLHRLHGPLRAAYSKLEAYCGRLALIFATIRETQGRLPQPRTIDDAAVEAAETLVAWFAREAERVYSRLGEDDEEREQRELVETIRKHGGAITANELYHTSRQYSTTDEANGILHALVEDGLARWAYVPPGAKGGRPTQRCVLIEQ